MAHYRSRLDLIWMATFNIFNFQSTQKKNGKKPIMRQSRSFCGQPACDKGNVTESLYKCERVAGPWPKSTRVVV